MILETLFSFLLFGGGLAQRPSTASICDYYAIQTFGGNTTATQFQLMQSILALAFAGPTQSMTNVSSDITGIFSPGVFQGTPVDLQPWFNGSIDSTNLNNQPVGIDWLDGGGKAPLQAFLNGQASTISFPNTTNEYRLFTHWISAFSHIFGCTLPEPEPASTYLNLAYVHKFMDLNYTDVGHFINQLTASSMHWGFSAQDAQTLNTEMNAQYNVRCAPPVPNAALGPQLYSLCQDPSCPLAAPDADCAAYVDLGPSGINSSPSSTGTSTASGSNFTPSTVSPTTIATTTSSTTSAAATSATTTAASSKATLSPGGIAGASIGGAAVVFAFIAGLIWMLRKKKENDPYVPNPSNTSYIAPSYTDHHASYLSGQTTQHYTGPPLAEMESPKHGASPEMTSFSPTQT